MDAWVVQQAIYTTFCALGFVAACIPLYWHFEAGNMGTIVWIFWAGTGSLIYFINGIIWRDNTMNVAPIWCDIVTRFLHVQPIGICLASALINHRLWRLTKVSVVQSTDSDKRRRAILDLSVGLGVPAVFMGAYWFIQGHRFDIYEGIGCYPTTPLTTVWLGTFGVWPTLITLTSACFGVLAIMNFLRLREETSVLSISEKKSLVSYRYFRLMVFSSIDILYLLPLNIVLLFFSLNVQFYPWAGLADLHFGFSAVTPFPVKDWQFTTTGILQTLLPPVTAILSCFEFFLVFGLAKDTRVHYRELYDTICSSCKKLVKLRTSGSTLPSVHDASSGQKPGGLAGVLTHLTMPSFIQRVPTTSEQRHRRGSMSSVLSVAIMIEGFSVYDDAELGHADSAHSKLKSLKHAEPAYRPYERTADARFSHSADIIFPSPPLPPGLDSAQRPSFPSVAGTPILRTPPQHSFHGPKSVLSSMNSLDNV